jgi:hypothetical protein
MFSRVQLVGMSEIILLHYDLTWHICLDDDELADSSNLDGLGTIKLTFRAVRVIGSDYRDTNRTGIPEQRRISEREKKGIEACVAWV